MTDLRAPFVSAAALDNDVQLLTTEEPFKDNPELLRNVEIINKVNPEDHQVSSAVIVDRCDPNKLVDLSDEDDVDSLDDSLEDPQEIIIDNITHPTSSIPTPISMTLVPNTPATTVTTTALASGNLDITSPVDGSSQKTEDDEDEYEIDEELMRITESNRMISVDRSNSTDMSLQQRSKSLRSQSVSTRRNLLVFADKPTVTKKSDRIVVANHYGAGPGGTLTQDLKPTRRSRSYLVACDFSEGSYHAIEWTMGTMMRDGDKLYVVAAVNREDNPEAVKQAGMSLSKELNKASETITEESKKILGQMLLFDVDLVTYAICGKVKDVLTKLIGELPLTMVVCGSRGKNTVKGLLMGSISTYLVHKSPVPVTVIRPQKKKKVSQKRHIHTVPLSQSVQSGQLAVDEIAIHSSNSSSCDPVITKK